MANLIQKPTSVSLNLRSGPSLGWRLLALALCVVLTLGSVCPGLALAGEVDSEGEGSAPPVEVPVPPDFDPGGEETGMEEAPAAGGGEEGVVETEPEVDIAAPPPEAVTNATTEAPVEAAPPPVSEPTTASPGPVQQQASEPVANQPIAAPKQPSVKRHAAVPGASSEVRPPAEPIEQEAPTPKPVAALPANPVRNLAGMNSYVVRPGDCLWHIAADLLAGSVSAEAVAREVQRLWKLNEDQIGTGDPNLIYAWTELRLR